MMKMTVCATFKSFKWEKFLTLVILKTRSRSKFWHATKGFVMRHLRYKYQMVTEMWTFVCPIGYDEKIQLWCIKSSDQTFGMLCSTHVRCLQVWYGTPWTSGLILGHTCLQHRQVDRRTDHFFLNEMCQKYNTECWKVVLCSQWNVPGIQSF